MLKRYLHKEFIRVIAQFNNTTGMFNMRTSILKIISFFGIYIGAITTAGYATV